MFKIKIILSLMLFISCLKGPGDCCLINESETKFLNITNYNNNMSLNLMLSGEVVVTEKLDATAALDLDCPLDDILEALKASKLEIMRAMITLPDGHLIAVPTYNVLNEAPNLNGDNLCYLLNIADYAEKVFGIKVSKESIEN